MNKLNKTVAEEKIAIIGIGCRFPGGASDHRTLWQNLINGKDFNYRDSGQSLQCRHARQPR